MIDARRIALDPTVEQRIHLARAAGVARFAYNWALAEWERQYVEGGRPSVKALRRQWNATRRTDFPWSLAVTKCAGAQAISNLGTAFENWFRDLKKPKNLRRFRHPTFKKRSVKASFALWNDQFEVRNRFERFGKPRGEIRIPNLGWVRMREPLSIGGIVQGAVVSRDARGWSVAIACRAPDAAADPAPGPAVGVDVGIRCLLALSRPLPDGRVKIDNPRPLHPKGKAMRRIRRTSRRLARQEQARKRRGARTSGRMRKRRAVLGKIHAQVAAVRRDAIHKATAAIVRAFGTIGIEDLNVVGMTKGTLAGAIHDSAFGEIQRQILYKAERRGVRVHLADRFFSSSKTCSHCGHAFAELPRGAAEWRCSDCGTHHDRDLNAARNLERIAVGRASSEPAPGDPAPTRGEMEALADSRESVKPPSVNRELDPCSPLGTN